MEGNSSSTLPSGYLTLKDLQERWLKRKQDEEEVEKLRKLRLEEGELEMEGNSSSTFPSGYVTLKDLQERWLKRKQDEEEEEKLRKLRQEEESKPCKQKEEEKRPHKGGRRRGGARKNVPSSRASAAFPDQREKEPERIEKKSASGVSAKASETIGAKSDVSSEIASSGRGRTRGSARHGVPPRKPQSVVNIAGKKPEKQKKGESLGTEQTAEIIERVDKIYVAGAYVGRSGGGNRERRLGYGATIGARIPTSGSGMVWVKKTTEA